MNAWILAVLLRLPVYHEDRASEEKAQQMATIAAAIAENSRNAPLPPRDWARLLITIGFHESAFSLRIMAGNCRPAECDRGKAKGAWQIHRNTLNRDSWAKQDGDIALQARLASDALKRAWGTCRGSGVEPVRATLSAYAGKRCGADWSGLGARLSTFQRLR